MTMWRIGIIGAGHYGEAHAQAIAQLDDAVLVAASRTNAEALAAFTARYGGVGYTDYAQLLNDPAVDVVVIATPHHLHTHVAIEAARAGKHILLEKPMAPTLPECQQIADAAHEAGVSLMLGHVNHFAPAYVAAKAILDSGEMGEVVLGTATMQKQWMEPNRRSWHLDRAEGGGVWMTVGVHPLDRMTWLINAPVTSVARNAAPASSGAPRRVNSTRSSVIARTTMSPATATRATRTSANPSVAAPKSAAPAPSNTTTLSQLPAR